MNTLDGSLREAETRLRAAGLSGADAFDALLSTIMARSEGGEGHPELRDLPLPSEGVDLLGIAYERFFPDLFKGRHGQYFTPPGLIRLLLARLPIGPGVDVLDPTCGSGGLLVAAHGRGARLRGIDVDPRLVRLARVNTRLHGATAEIQRADFFRTTPVPADVVIANPPFSVPIRDPEVLERFEATAGREKVVSDVLFLEALADWVRPGGWAGVVVPWNIVANPRAQPVRDRLDAAFQRTAVLALPEGVFRPFGGAQGRAALLWLRRRPCPSSPTQWGSLRDPGYDTRSKRLRHTSTAEIEHWLNPDSWRSIGGWTPPAAAAETCVGTMAVAHGGTERFAGETTLIELSDVDPSTQEALPRLQEIDARRQVIKSNEVLVSRLRPERGNVTLSPVDGHGSPEWIRLESPHPHLLFHMLRSPQWHTNLPPTSGQTRPRTDASAVLATPIRAPSGPTREAFEGLSKALHDRRRHLRDTLLDLQFLMDAYQAGEIDEAALESGVVALGGRVDGGAR